MLQLERVIYPQVHSSIKLQEGSSMELENRFSLNVNFDDKSKKCIATFDVQSVCTAHTDWFDVSVQIVGFFSFDKIDTDDDRKQAHNEVYGILFTYAQSMVSELTAKAGIVPLMLEKASMDFDEVKNPNS